MAVVRRIGIDPGHGGRDLGATRPGFIERDAVEMAAEVLHCYLVARDILPVHTRASGEDPWFFTRGVRTRNCAAVVSLHVNAHTSPAINGLEIYHWPGSKGGIGLANEIACRCPVGLVPSGRKECRIYSAKDDPRSDWLQRPRAVLRCHHPPAVLVELGYCSNPANRAYLQSGGLDAACVAIADAVVAWLAI